MNRFLVLMTISTIATSVVAQNKPPIVTTPIADFPEYAGAPARSIDLATFFSDPDASAAVRVTTVLGAMDFALLAQEKPLTVANFLRYVNEGRYFKIDPTTNRLASIFFHRSIANFIIQSGGFIGTVNPSSPNSALPVQVLIFPAVQNEPGISNKRGTIAMAKVSGDPNSATSQWFINLADNGGSPPNGLDFQNGGFTVFGRVAGNGMTVADAIAALPRYNFGAPFDSLPLRNYTSPNTVSVENFVSLPAIAQISPLNFSATSDNPAIAEAAVSGTNLLVTGKQVGSSHITVTATDLDGASVAQSFNVNVGTAPGRLVNISTRLQVGTNEDVLIAGFFVQGGTSKRLLVRGIGPSLSASGIPDFLVDPILELHDASGAIITTNDNWTDNANKQEIIDTGIAPSSAKESAILATVPSGSNPIAYTAILRGVNNTTGIGLVEVYDLESGPGSVLLNISTRGRVETGNSVLIGGFFIGGTESKRILIRGIGPSLADAAVANSLADPTLELHDAQGVLIDSNNDWQSNPKAAEIQASGIAPTKAKESVVLNTLAPGAYTAIVRGLNNTTGVAAVEAYQLP